MNDHVLIHTDEGSDELYHFKYVKRYKANGKWHYVYDAKTAAGAKMKEFIATKVTGSAYKQHLNEAYDRYSSAYKKEHDAIEDTTKSFNDYVDLNRKPDSIKKRISKQFVDKEYNMGVSRNKTHGEIRVAAAKQMDEAAANYKKTLGGKVAGAALKTAGAATVASLKAKDFINKKLKKNAKKK